MELQLPQEMIIKIIRHPKDFKSCCGNCRKILRLGEFCICAKIDGDQYLLNGLSETCCGRSWKTLLVYEDEVDAERAVREIQTAIEEWREFKFTLFPYTGFPTQRIH